MRSGVVMVTSGFPRRSETFALNELLALEERGWLAAVFATKPGDGARPHPGAERLAEHVRVLPPGTPAEQAEALVAQLNGHRVTGVHGYFAHVPAEVAALAAGRIGVPWGFSVHARDARKVTPAELARRTRAAACVVACNADVAGELPPDGAVHLVPHGVDLERFRPRRRPRDDRLRLLAVGRLVEKKGFHVLVEALARLDEPFRLRVVGDGPERPRLEAAVRAGGLDGAVAFCADVTHAELPAEYAAADVVVAPSVVDRTGDRDGLPNAVLEAMACGRAVVASAVGAVPSAIADGVTGVLVPPGDADALAAALRSLARSGERRERLGRAARAFVEREFALARCTDRLEHVLEAAYA